MASDWNSGSFFPDISSAALQLFITRFYFEPSIDSQPFQQVDGPDSVSFRCSLDDSPLPYNLGFKFSISRYITRRLLDELRIFPMFRLTEVGLLELSKPVLGLLVGRLSLSASSLVVLDLLGASDGGRLVTLVYDPGG